MHSATKGWQCYSDPLPLVFNGVCGDALVRSRTTPDCRLPSAETKTEIKTYQNKTKPNTFYLDHRKGRFLALKFSEVHFHLQPFTNLLLSSQIATKIESNRIMSASAYTLHFKSNGYGSTKVVVSAPNEGATFCISVDYSANNKKRAFVVHYDGENICGAAAFIAGRSRMDTFAQL